MHSGEVGYAASVGILGAGGGDGCDRSRISLALSDVRLESLVVGTVELAPIKTDANASRRTSFFALTKVTGDDNRRHGAIFHVDGRARGLGANCRGFFVNATAQMNRYFLASAILDESSIQLDRDDVFVVWEINEVEDGEEAIRTTFDFSRNFGGGVNNLVARRIARKASFDGLIANVILRSGNWREVDRAEYSRIHACLDDKSLRLEKVKRRERVVETEYGMGDGSSLP